MFISRPQIAEVGTPQSEKTVWKDLKAPFHGRRIDVSSGHLDYNTDELGIDFDDTSRFVAADMIGIMLQMNHDYKIGSNVRPHIHWIQSSVDIPNAAMSYRVYDNGETPPAWTSVKYSGNIFTYTAPDPMLQIMTFPEIDMSSITGVSSFVDIKLYRDHDNTSTLFAGADPLTGDALMKEFDLHYELDMNGSREELSK